MGTSPNELDSAIRRACDLIRTAKHAVALVGAGMSVESRIPPFRGPGGLWTRYGEPTSLSYEQFAKDPIEWWATRLAEEEQPGTATYEMRTALDGASPNPGHFALVELERMGLLKHIITQNVDNLHSRAGSVNVAEIHGNRTKLRCTDCMVRLLRDEYPVVELPPPLPEMCRGHEDRHRHVRRAHTRRRSERLFSAGGVMRLYADDRYLGHCPPSGRDAQGRQRSRSGAYRDQPL